MLLPHILSTLLLLINQVNTDDLPCLVSPSNITSTSRSCNKVNHTDVLVSRKRFRKQAGRSGLGGCGNTEIKSIMERVMVPLLHGRRMKIGDIAKRLQVAVQQATGKSHEIFMGKGDMQIASHQMDDGTSCKQRVGEFFTTVYETPIQYDISNLEQEQFLSTIDFGEPLGGSGYPGQEPFPQLVRTPSEAGTNALGEAGRAEQTGRANAEPEGGPRVDGCENDQLRRIMNRVVPPLLNATQPMRIGNITRALQLAVQQETGKSFEIFMGRSEMSFSSHQISPLTSCRMRIGEYYTAMYETPVQYNIFDTAEEESMANVDFGQGLDGGPRLGGCENAQLRRIMNRVVPPLLNANEANETQRMRIGDIAWILQLAVQNETGRSFEVFMGRSEMSFSSHQISPLTSCRRKIGEYYTTMYETPVQYNIFDTAEEESMANVDFGQGLDGGPRLGGCENLQLRGIMNRVVPPLLNANEAANETQRMRIGDIARILQLVTQNETGRSFEVFMGRSDLSFSSHQISPLSSCRMRIGEYYTAMYETPVQYNLLDLAEEEFMANVDFFQELGSTGNPGQIFFREFAPFDAPLQGPPLWPQYNPPVADLVFYPPPPAPPPVFAQMECFSADLMVETIEGPKRMDELKTGDEVLSIDESMISFSPIIMFLHRDEELMAEFNVITTAKGKSVKLTNEHLIFVSDCDMKNPLRLVKANEVTTDDCVMSSQTSSRALNVDRVTNVTKVYERGIFSPLTATGDIIVNGILSSCHSNLGVRTLQQSVLEMYQYLYESLSFFLPEMGSFPVGLAYLTSTLDLFLPVKATLG